jgi:hypothetical protein
MYPPLTEEKILRAKVDELTKEYGRLSKENIGLKYKNSKLEWSLFETRALIETARQEWSRGKIDNSEIISNLVLSVRKQSAQQSVQADSPRVCSSCHRPIVLSCSCDSAEPETASR